MQLIRFLAGLLMGTLLLFLVACGPASGDTPPAKTPAANPVPTMDMTPVPGQTATQASFSTSNLVVTPDKAKAGDMVMVGVTVTNSGTQQGTYTVTVKDHDGKLLGTKDVTLAGGAKEDVSLQISVNVPGTHMIMIDKLWRNLVIEQDMAAMPPMQPGQPVQPAQPPAEGTPSVFRVVKLGIDPEMPEPGDDVVVSVTVQNSGSQQGTYKIVVKINGEDAVTKDVTLAAGASEIVNVNIKAPAKEGTYAVSVGDQRVNMVVMAM